MLVRTLALGAVASLSCALAANASDWGGYYVGLHAGQGAAEADTARAITGPYFLAANRSAVESASEMTLDEDTFAGGAQIGVNWPLSEQLLLGAELDASGYGNDTSATTTLVYPVSGPSTFTVGNSIEQTWLATARLRLGFTSGWFMGYVTGGYAGADMKFKQTFSDTFAPILTQTVENSEFRSGHSFGAGVEVMIESGASLKFEYMHYDLGEVTASGPIAAGATTSDGVADVTNNVWRVGFNFQID